MIRFRNFLLALLCGAFLFITPSYAQNKQALSGFCDDGGQTVTTVGIVSTTKVQRSYPGCTITVRDAGTLNLSTIFADAAGTPKSNPFTANPTTGYWFFYANPGQYDAVLSGAGMVTYTRGGLWVIAASSGTITSSSNPTTDNAIVRWDGTTGSVIQNSTVILGDTGNLTGVGTINTHTIPGGTDTFTANNAVQTLTNKTLDNTTDFSGFYDLFRIATPANAPSGYLRIYANNATGLLACIDAVGANCAPSGGGGGTPGGVSGNLQWNSGGTFAGLTGSTVTSAAEVSLNTSARVSPSNAAYAFTGGGDTAMTADTENVFGRFASTTRGFNQGGGAFATQREWIILSPTYTFTSADSITNAATLAIQGGPIAGTNATITNQLALWIQKNALQLGTGSSDAGLIRMMNSTNVNALTLSSGTTTSQYTLTFPAAPPAGNECIRMTSGGALQTTGSDCGSGGGTTINPSDNVIPYRQNGTTFQDSNWSVGNNLAATSTVGSRSGGSAAYLRILTPADVLQAADTVSPGIQFGGNTSASTVTRQFSSGGGSFTNQYEYFFVAPTYSFTSADSIVTGATVYINGPPAEGTNATIGQKLALWSSGDTRVDGKLTINTGTATPTGQLHLITSSPTLVPIFADGDSAQTAQLLLLRRGSTQTFAVLGRGQLDMNPAASTTGTPPASIDVVTPAHTDLSNAEATEIFIGLDGPVNFTGGGGAIANQRAMRFGQPTYNADAAQTITQAATLAITGAPVASTNVTFTNTALSLFVESGAVQFGRQSTAASNLRFANASNNNILTVSSGVTSTSYTWTFPLSAPGGTQCLQMDSSGNVTTTGSGCSGGGLPVVDTTSIVEGSADNTKEIRFEVDGLTTGTVRVLTPPNANITIAGADFANAWSDGVKQTFNPNDTNAGINVGENAAEPSSPADGDIFYDADGEQLKARINGAWVVLGAGGSGCTVAGSQGDYQVNNGAGACAAGVITQGSNGRLVATPTAITSGVTGYFRLVTPGDTDMTSNTESIGTCIGGTSACATVTRNWVDGTTQTLQRENVIPAPTYTHDGATTVTDAVTLEIGGAPIDGGANTTFTRSTALMINNLSTLNDIAIHVRNVDFGSNQMLLARDSGGQDRLILSRDGMTCFESACTVGNRFSSGSLNLRAAAIDVAILKGGAGDVTLAVTGPTNQTADLVNFTLTADDTTTAAPILGQFVNSNGTPGNNFGGQQYWALETTTTNSQFAASETIRWSDATHASRTSEYILNLVDNATAGDKFFVRANGQIRYLGLVRQTSNNAFTSNTTFANLTGLTFNVVSGRNYKIKFQVYVDYTSGTGGGAKLTVSGTAGFSAILAGGYAFQTATLNDMVPSSSRRITALGSTIVLIGAADGGSQATMVGEGTFLCNSSGTITIQGAQQASDADTTTFLTNSTFEIWEISN